MKRCFAILLFIILATSLFLPSSTAFAKGLAEGEVVFGGSYRLESGQTLDGDLVIFGAVATLEEDSVVNGSVILFGANLDISGEVNGDVVGLGGLISLNETARIHGDVLSIGSHMDKSSGALVMGAVNDITKMPYSFSFPGELNIPNRNIDFTPGLNFAWYVLKVFLWAALAALVVLFVPQASGRVAQAFLHQPLIAAGLGLLTVILAIPLALVFIVTIIFAPMGLFIFLLLGLCWAFGLIAIGLEIGKRFAALINRQWADPILATIGTFFLMLVINGVNEMVPCIGWMLPAAVGLVGVGAVLMTRLGTQTYPLFPEAYTSPAKAPAYPSQPHSPRPDISPEPSIEKPIEEELPPEDTNNINPT
ncbi:MAG: polymer-forming cytoskeletal protein [Anaerolineales bacterium]|nr:polymer-forming cytoskeletal protein [Anaerolineales bacterium]